MQKIFLIPEMAGVPHVIQKLKEANLIIVVQIRLM